MYRNNATGRGEKWPSRGEEGGVKGTAEVSNQRERDRAARHAALRNSVYTQKIRMRYSWNNLFRRGNVTYLRDIFARAFSPSFLHLSSIITPLFFLPSPCFSPTLLASIRSNYRTWFAFVRIGEERNCRGVIRSMKGLEDFPPRCLKAGQ